MSNSALKSLQSATIKMRFLRSFTPTSDSPTRLHQNCGTPPANNDDVLRRLSSLSHQKGEYIVSPPSTPIKSPRMRLVGSQSKTSTLISTRLSTSSKDFVNASNHVDSRPKSHDVHTQKYATPTRHHLVFAKEQNDSTNSPQNILTRPEDILTQCLGCPSPPDSGKTPDVGTTLLTSAEKRNCLKAYLQKPVNLQCCTKNALPFDSPVKNKLISEGVEGGIDVKPFILGRGGFGTVVLANWKGNKVAVKVIKKHSKRRRSIEIAIRNEENGIQLSHPNVVQTFGIYGSEKQHTLIVMEFAGNRHLGNVIENATDVIDWQRRLHFALQIASALQWCHYKRIIHLDIKPANVIVNNMDVCKLCDFGCSKNIDEVKSRSSLPDDEEWHCLGGTVAYRAPELLRGDVPTIKADIYSFAFILWQLLTRETPFAGWESHVLVYKVVACDARPPNPQAVDPAAVSYIHLYSQLWVRDIISRPTIDFTIEKIYQIHTNLLPKP